MSGMAMYLPTNMSCFFPSVVRNQRVGTTESSGTKYAEVGGPETRAQRLALLCTCCVTLTPPGFVSHYKNCVCPINPSYHRMHAGMKDIDICEQVRRKAKGEWEGFSSYLPKVSEPKIYILKSWWSG